MWNLVKVGQAVSEMTFNDYLLWYMYTAQGQRKITSGDKIMIVTKMVGYFDHTLYVLAITH